MRYLSIILLTIAALVPILFGVLLKIPILLVILLAVGSVFVAFVVGVMIAVLFKRESGFIE